MIFIMLLFTLNFNPTILHASDQITISDQEMVCELTIYNLPLLDHTSVCTLALVNKKLHKDILVTKKTRKEALAKSALENKDLCTIKYVGYNSGTNGEFIYFNQYGSICIFFTYKNEEQPKVHCNWTLRIDGALKQFSDPNPVITRGELRFDYYYDKDGRCWKIINGLACYGMGHYLEGPYMRTDNSAFCFLNKKYNNKHFGNNNLSTGQNLSI